MSDNLSTPEQRLYFERMRRRIVLRFDIIRGLTHLTPAMAALHHELMTEHYGVWDFISIPTMTTSDHNAMFVTYLKLEEFKEKLGEYVMWRFCS